MTKPVVLDRWVMESIMHALAEMKYGSVTLRVHDGVIVSIDLTNERRLSRGLVKQQRDGVDSTAT